MTLEYFPRADSEGIVKKNISDIDARWSETVYVPRSMLAGTTEFRNGVFNGSKSRYDEIMLVLEGEADVSDRDTGQTFHILKGDCFLAKIGSRVTLRVKDYLKFWYVAHPPCNELMVGASYVET